MVPVLPWPCMQWTATPWRGTTYFALLPHICFTAQALWLSCRWRWWSVFLKFYRSSNFCLVVVCLHTSIKSGFNPCLSRLMHPLTDTQLVTCCSDKQLTLNINKSQRLCGRLQCFKYGRRCKEILKHGFLTHTFNPTVQTTNVSCSTVGAIS